MLVAGRRTNISRRIRLGRITLMPVTTEIAKKKEDT